MASIRQPARRPQPQPGLRPPVQGISFQRWKLLDAPLKIDLCPACLLVYQVPAAIAVNLPVEAFDAIPLAKGLHLLAQPLLGSSSDLHGQVYIMGLQRKLGDMG